MVSTGDLFRELDLSVMAKTPLAQLTDQQFTKITFYGLCPIEQLDGNLISSFKMLHSNRKGKGSIIGKGMDRWID